MFHGSMVALVTPMTKKGDIDYPTLDQLVEMHIDQGTAAIVAVGTTGEAATLDHKEKLGVIRRVIDVVKERVPVIAGTATNATHSTIGLTEEAMKAGADACLIMTPAYIKPMQEGLYQHYKAIAEAVAIPIIMYNVPSRTACDLLPETIKRLASFSNIIGIKEATGKLERVIEIRECCGDAIDVYSGDDPLTKDLILAGGKGVISVTANVAPKLMSDMCRAALAGDEAEATRINDQLVSLYKALFVESNPIPVKWAMQQMGLISEVIRLPLTSLSGAYHDTVRAALASAKLL